MTEVMNKPRCAVCKKPVDLFWYVSNPMARNGLGETVYIAKCHGQREQVSVTDEDMISLMPGFYPKITLCDAFATAKRPNETIGA